MAASTTGVQARTLRRSRCLWHGHRPTKLSCHYLLASATPAEQQLWCMLRGRQVMQAKFSRQYSIGPFIVAFFCKEARLVVESDFAPHYPKPHPLPSGEGVGVRLLIFLGVSTRACPYRSLDGLRKGSVNLGEGPQSPV
jgi:hypothetical protein